MSDKYRDRCIDDAVFHLKKATDALEGLKNPKAWYQASVFSNKVIAKALPYLLSAQLLQSPVHSDSETEES
jgi:hypothetical protein